MYVCICKGITDRQIREAVRAGASSMRDLRSRLDICSGCGKCGPSTQTILRASLDETRTPSEYPLNHLAAC